MTDRINDVLVVGGGDSGLIAALALVKLNPDLGVTVVDDFGRDIPQVGKSTFLKIREILHDTLEIDPNEFVSEVRPVWKASVYFRDWCGYPAFQYPFDVSEKLPGSDTPRAAEYCSLFYHELSADPDYRTRCEELVAQRKSPWYFSPSDGGYGTYPRTAYHLNTERFNTFLRELCRERGVSLVDDEVTAVETTGARVDRVRSKSQAYEADLYVDASGFNRVLKGELDAEFVDFELPLDSAFNARVDRPLSEVLPATVVETGDHGWFWGIDTFDNRDLGYVYASEYVAEEDALAEFLDHCEREGGVAREDVAAYEFTSGYYDRAWTGNCVAVGNAEGFVEPLQSTGLTANAQASVLLANLLSSHSGVATSAVREDYNTWVTRMWESVYDFISVHYAYADGETPFWRDVSSLSLSPRVERLVEAFDEHGFDPTVDPTVNDPDVDDLALFHANDFYLVMLNMGATSAFYEETDVEVSDAVREELTEYYRETTEDVADYYTTEEVYRAVLQV